MSQIKFCSGCETDKPIEEFAKKGKRRQHHCKKCKNLYTKQHYQENRQYYIDKALKRTQEIKDLVADLKTKCNRCPEKHPACLQFHHKDPTQKEFGISVAVKHAWSLKRIMAEIAKCEVLCANCHAKEHWS